MKLALIPDRTGTTHLALEVTGHYLEIRTLLRHPLASLKLVWGWLRASHEGSSS